MGLEFKNRTVHGVVEQLSSVRANDRFLTFEDQAFSYADVNASANAVAAGLQKLGIGKNDKVAVMMSNRPEFLFTWFGLSKLGAVEVPINTAHKGALLSYMLCMSDSVALVLEAGFADQVRDVLSDLGVIKHIIVLDGPVSLDDRVCSYDQMIENDGSFDRVQVLPSDPCAMMFTSGTTGPSKGALLPHNYQLVMAEIICSMAEYTEDDCLYNALPLFHGNAQTLSTMPALISGARMVLAKRFSASSFWSDVRKHGCTEFNYIGGILAILLKAEPQDDDRDNPLRVMVGAGANKEIFTAFEDRFGVQLVEGYGMSEIGTPLNTSPGDRRPGSCGTLNPGYQVKLIDDDGEEVGPNTPGELLIRPLQSSSMMLEYYKMPEKTVEAWQDLWFHTGDYLMQDEEGYFYFVDRKKDALRRRGENISSFEVEQGVNAHPCVLESAAVAVKSELGEDEVMICVALKPGQHLSAEDLIAHCEKQMAYFMVPRYVRFLPVLPKTPTERVQKYQLRDEGVTPDTFDREAAGKGQ
ncbi:ATP-dependent acyl-CoA ligase [Kordiimonas sediminis]|uniref:ATP-dependent acyl-CoA ligase n=1 Tax=Kordiimonas sediminis TaxID=1735581 RepID=A0A919E4X1_9PROT|nr:AMP-binding protein [Kordiimonas sediminis]GHF14014.1 ATP-dependent acyl-CoA ligase [Kordiimonas sediminis]